MKVSIITVCFNSFSTIQFTIESVLSQSYSDIEYLIIDGNSTDGTINIVKSYVPRFNGRLRWMSQKDRGIYDAMNKGIKMATGDVIGLLNSDDVLSSSDSVAKQMLLLEQSMADAVYADVLYTKSDDLSSSVRYYSSWGFKPWKMRLGFMPAHPTFYCKKNIYEKYGYFNLDYKIAADFECLLRFIYIHHIKTVYNPMQVVTMRIGGASSNRRQIMKDHLKAFHAHHIYSNVFILSLRYLFKMKDLIVGKFSSIND